MPTPFHRGARRIVGVIVRIAAPTIIIALLAFAVLNSHRTDQAVDELRKINDGQHTALVAGCERGNLLRAQVTTNVQVLDEFIAAAVAARRAEGDMAVARGYAKLRTKLKPLEQIDCQAAYPDTPR